MILYNLKNKIIADVQKKTNYKPYHSHNYVRVDIQNSTSYYLLFYLYLTSFCLKSNIKGYIRHGVNPLNYGYSKFFEFKRGLLR